MMIIVTPTGTTSSTRMSTGALTKGRLRGGLPRHCVQPVEITAARCGTVLVLSLITNSVAAAVPPDNSSTAQVMTPAAPATSGVPRLVSFGFEPPSPAHLSSTHGFPERQVGPVQLVQVLNPQTS